MNEKKIIKVLTSKDKAVLPIWVMRQAGRYLPEYREVRSKVNNFLDLCYNPKLATEVTLQPIRRFGFDAAIIFSDILVIPDALGVKVDFVKNEGPRLEIINSVQKLKKLNFDNFLQKLKPVYQAISSTRSALPNDKALIGFAGGPWTIATYMVQGRGSKDFAEAKIAAYQNEEFFTKMIDLLTEAIIIHLSNQIDSGAEIIQLFDSWAGILDEYLFDRLVVVPTKKIVEAIKSKYSNIPIIGFPKASGVFYKKYIEETNIDAIGLDSSTPIKYVKDLNQNITLQGNLDPTVLFASKDIIKKQVMYILDASKDMPFIFNLGHGILPETPVENVYYLLELVRNYKK